MEGRAHHTGLRLSLETSVFALLVVGWLWGIVALGGAQEMAPQGAISDGGGPSDRAVVSCPAPREPGAEGGAAVGSDACRVEARLHTGTSRQPGRSSGNAPSTHSGE